MTTPLRRIYLFIIAILLVTLFCILSPTSNNLTYLKNAKGLQRNESLAIATVSSENFSSDCSEMLDEIAPMVSVYLIDLDILRRLKSKNCSKWRSEVKMATSYTGNFSLNSSFLRMEMNDDKNFFTFYDDDEEIRIVPKYDTYSYKTLEIPKDINRFEEFWKRSRFVKCLGLKMNRNIKVPKIDPAYGTVALTSLVQELLKYDMYPNLNGGSLLGWYRECDIIPHTSDMDIQVEIEQFDHHFKRNIRRGHPLFHMVRSLGLIQDGLEYTIKHKPSGYNIDIFFLYDNGNETYVGGTGGDGSKYQYSYPIVDLNCAGELHGHIYWVSCDPEKSLTHEYGPNWRKDHPTSKYAWNGSGSNLRKAGKVRKELRKKALQYY